MGESNKATMDRDDAEEYTQALGQVFGGGWRLVLHAHKQGVPQALGLSTREWVKERLGGHMQLEVEERKQAVAELTAPEEDGGEGLSNVQAAEVLGVDERTVRRDKPSANAEPEPEPELEPQVEAVAEDAPSANAEPYRPKSFNPGVDEPAQDDVPTREVESQSEPEQEAQAAVQEAADALPAEAETTIRASQLRSNHSNYWSQTRNGLLQLDPRAVANVLDQEERQRYLDLAATNRAWLDSYEAALKETGLRMVSG